MIPEVRKHLAEVGFSISVAWNRDEMKGAF